MVNWSSSICDICVSFLLQFYWEKTKNTHAVRESIRVIWNPRLLLNINMLENKSVIYVHFEPKMRCVFPLTLELYVTLKDVHKTFLELWSETGLQHFPK